MVYKNVKKNKKVIAAALLIILIFSAKISVLAQYKNIRPLNVFEDKGKPLYLCGSSDDYNSYESFLQYDEIDSSLHAKSNRLHRVYEVQKTPNKIYYFADEKYGDNVSLYCDYKLIKSIWAEHDCPKEIVNYGDTIIFATYDSYKGRELWMSDGTSQGTKLLLDLKSNEGSSNPHSFLCWENYLFFVADGSKYGSRYDLWMLDLKTNKCKLVSDNFTGCIKTFDFIPNNYIPMSYCIMNDNLIYIGNNKEKNFQCLWGYNIKNGITNRLISFEYGYEGDEIEMTYGDNLVFFSAKDTTLGTELWVSDGTPKGTRLLMDINPGYLPSNPSIFTVVNNQKVFFLAEDDTHGRELWMVDTNLKPKMVWDIIEGPVSVVVSDLSMHPVGDNLFITYKNRLLFNITKTNHISKISEDLYEGYERKMKIGKVIEIKGVIYFITHDDIWKSNGTIESTKIINAKYIR
jgi:ELWxxDGT repeat protein